MRWIRAVAAATVLLLGIVGSPAALAAWGRYPAELAGLRADDGSLLLATLTLLGWAAWGAFSVATVAELLAQLTGRVVRLPGFGVLQYLAGGLLALVLAALPAAEIVTSGEPLAQLAAERAAGAEPSPSAAAAQERHPAPAEAERPGYLVAAGDDLWTIAERLFGDGRQWRTLSDLNPQLADPLQELQPGSKLNLPATATTLAAPSGDSETVRVKKGDTLSELAQEHLGSAAKWPRIAAANDIITDPDHIEIGWKLHLPAGKAQRPPVSSATPAEARPSPPDGERRVRPDVDALPVEAAPTPPAPEVPTQDQADDSSPATAPLTVGTLAAAAVVGTLELRRALRQRERPLGSRLPPATEGANRLRTELRASEDPEALTALVAALRQVGRHCFEHDQPLPVLASVRVGVDEISLDWAEPASPPPFGFAGDADRWLAPVRPALPDSDHPCPYPALVSLGTAEDGEVLLIDAERSRVLGVAGDDEQRRNALTAMGIELACAPWSAETRLVASGAGAGLIGLAGDDRVQVAGVELALAKLRQVVARRRQALSKANLSDFRVDPDRADAVAAYVFCFLDEVSAEVVAELEALLVGEFLGVAVILGASAESPAQWEVGGQVSRPQGRLAGRPGSLAAHAIDAEVRAHLGELLTDAEPVPAPWWAEDNVYPLPIRDGEEVDIVRLVEPAVHPRLMVIGPAELRGARGPEPSRSRQQLTELCAWMLEHPGSTATQMATGLSTAETTRRSNLSRLRNWLGADDAGEAYLPEAYSGRISLHPGVSSDWQELQVLLAPGLKRVADSTLVAALQLVRGAPLADAAPGQWYWAEELRTEIAAALRDVGVVLVERALTNGDIELARWAAARALVVAPEDELLLCARLRTEYQAGNLSDVERLVNQLTRQARVLGVDLMPETVELCQQVIEGRARARA